MLYILREWQIFCLSMDQMFHLSTEASSLFDSQNLLSFFLSEIQIANAFKMLNLEMVGKISSQNSLRDVG